MRTCSGRRREWANGKVNEGKVSELESLVCNNLDELREMNKKPAQMRP